MSEGGGFNVLTDPWVPLDDGTGQPAYASYAALLQGERDATDLAHPRDDCRFFARMLLSALTQALFPVANAAALRRRMETPLAREEASRRIGAVKTDFELVGEDGFMQTTLTSDELAHAADPSEATETATASLLLDVPRNSRHLLFRPAAPCDAVCPRCAVVLTYGIQAFAMEDGKSGFGLRGKSPSIRRAPATTTLVVTDSVRTTAWANVLHAQAGPELAYATDGDRPWRQARVDKPKGAPIGLVEGLFWQPRAFHLTWMADGKCFACGATGRRVAPCAWRSKSRAADAAFFRHPWSPVVEDVKKHTFRYVHLQSDRPAWTGLVDLIAPASGGTGSNSSVWHAAPAVRQWQEALTDRDAALIVFDIGTTRRDRATPASRLCETFPLSARLVDRDVADAVRTAVQEAEKGLDALRTACIRVHMNVGRAREGKLSAQQRQRMRTEKESLHDLTTAFWQRTEPAFWVAYEAFVGMSVDAQAEAQDALRATIRRAARDLFDNWAAASLADPSRIAIVADARARLRGALAAIGGRRPQPQVQAVRAPT